jgi:hypothetical protein
MRPSRALACLLLSVAILACGGPPPQPVGTVAPPAAPRETDPSEPPPGTIPPGFVFPVPFPLTAGNADIYAQRALFARTGSMCFTHMDVDGGIGGIDFDALAATLDSQVGLLEDGRSYVGPLAGALPALDLEPTGIDVDGVAYGIGVVTAERAEPQLPAGTVWAPRLERFGLADGRSGWTLSGPWVAVVDRSCGVLPATAP